MIVSVEQWLENSLIYSLMHRLLIFLRPLSGRIKGASSYLCKGSILEKLYKGSICFLEKESQSRKSLFHKAMSQFGSLLNRAAQPLNSFFKLQWENSLFSKIAKGSVILKDYERSVYILALYVFIDYILRDVLRISVLASYWDELFFVVCFGLWVYKGILNAKSDNPLERGYRWTPLDAPLLFFIGVSIVLFIFNSPSMRIGFEGLRAVIQYSFWFFAAMQLLKSFEGVKRVLYILLAVGTLIGIHGIYQYIIAVPIPSNWVDIAETPVRTRVFSILKSPNILGSFMVLIGPLSLAFAANQKVIWKKLIFFGAFGVMSLCLLFTYSKMALFAYVAALGIYFLIKDKRLVLALIIAVAAVYLFVPSVGNRISYLLSPEYIISSLRGGRMLRWGQGLKILQENLLFGVGPGNFGGAVAMNNKVPGTFYMDNYYLKTAVESGLAGLGAFIVLVLNIVVWGLRAIHKAYKAAQMEKFNYAIGIYAGLLGVLTHNLVENVFEVPMMNTYIWLMAAILMFSGFSLKSKVG